MKHQLSKHIYSIHLSHKAKYSDNQIIET